MKNRVVWFTAIVIGFLGIYPSHAQDVVNLLGHGGFEEGPATPLNTWAPLTWNLYSDGQTLEVVSEDAYEGEYCLKVTVPAQTTNIWDAGFKQPGHVFEDGKAYTFSAWMKSLSGPLDINMKLERDGGDYSGTEQLKTITEEWAEYSITTPVYTETVDPAAATFHIGYAVGEFLVDGIRMYEGEYVPPPPTTVEERAAASEPNPLDGADNLPNDTTLSWIAGEFAATHDVYLGKVFEDVNDASRANPMNVLVNQNQILSTYEHPEPLEFGQVYYWRIDEVNASPDIIYKGQVWSFEVEPYVLPITNVTATANSYEQNQGPGNTVDGSGLNANDGHSTIAEDMWLSNIDGPQPTWIQYEFDKAYVLLEMWVWNSNQTNERAFGLGIRSVTIDYSLDGQEWTKFDDAEFNKATGSAGYMYNTTVNLEGIYAKYIRLTANNNWGELLEQYGLSEVRFFQIPVQASIPQPDSEAYDVALDVVLDWRAGRQAVQHEVYFSSNEQDVIDGTALLDTVSETWYQVGSLDYGKVYYWKINEVNDAASTPSWEGEIWSFSTTGFMAVDDFESYDADNPIWESWIDGLGFGSLGTPGYNPGNGTGAAVGDENTSSFTEETIVNSGRQSMPFLYNNNKPGSANYSETEHTLDQTANWAERGITELSLWFRGYSGSVGSFIEGPTGTYTLTGSGADIWAVDGVEADEFHFAYKMLNGAGSIIAKVESVQNTNEWAKAGIMIRETLDPESAHAMVVVTPEQGVSFQRRFDTAGTSTEETTSDITAPHWVKLERTISGIFTASHSTNGTTWQTLGTQQNIQMNANVYIGLAVTAHDADLACEAVFSNVTTTGSVTGQWMNQDIGITSNDPEPFYVALADTSGVIGVVTYEDPAATQINTWTKWDIDLSQFSDQGMDLTSIQKIMLGVGDRNNPVAGGMGKIYVDDIMIGNPAPPREFRNLLINGNFESSALNPWYIYDNTGGEASAEIVRDDPVEGNSCLHVVVPTAGVNFYDVGLVQPGLVFETGKKYTLSAFFKCKEGTLDISFKPEHAAGSYEDYGVQTITITDQWTEYSVATPVLSAQVDPAAVTFHIGFTPGEFWVDNVRFYEGDYVVPPAESPPSEDTENKLGHGGFEDGASTPLGTWAPLTWNLYSSGQTLEVVSEDAIEGDYCLKVTVPEATANFWDAGFKQPGHVFEEGKSYTFSAWMKSLSGPLDINMKLERDGGDYSGTEQMVTISEEWAEYSITTPVYTETVDPAAATFHIGYAVGEFLIDNIRLYEGPYIPSE